MRKLYKSQEFKSIRDILLDINLNRKSKYLKNLEKKKNESYKIINRERIEIIKENLIRVNKLERDYSIFSREKLRIYPRNKNKNKFIISPNIKPIFLSAEEEAFPNKYKKKQFNIDTFSLIYKETNSTNYSKSKLFKPLITSSYTKFNEKGKFKSTKKYNLKSNFELNKNIEHNYNLLLFNRNKNNETSPPFLTSVGKKFIINKRIQTN